uniref:izumo sperm-egg fusion protein 3 n=1 Tax=Euleptes europaea TaxID=460621 RepID=UPI00253FEA92|nr:izumo sperm-egg fusion protein 3 [Euleptes europaea]
METRRKGVTSCPDSDISCHSPPAASSASYITSCSISSITANRATIRGHDGGGPVAVATMPRFLLAFPLLLWSLRGVSSCLHCDRPFLDSVATLLKERLPADLSGRDALIEQHIRALAELHGTFLQNHYERVLDVRGVMSIKADIIKQLQEIKKQPWKGVFLWQLSMYHLRVSLKKRMKQTLEQFADLGIYPKGKAVTEGPVLDCWTCLRIAIQCFDGELCGEEDERVAEHKEIILYVFLVCESVLISSAVLVYLVCFKHKEKMLRKALAQ